MGIGDKLGLFLFNPEKLFIFILVPFSQILVTRILRNWYMGGFL
jgi:hypothetical protein